MTAVVAYVGLGSNLGDRRAAIVGALDALEASEAIELCGTSPIIETEPIGPVEQGAFLNAVARIRTTLTPRALLGRLLAIERAAGRDRRDAVRWGPRLLDLDLLLYGDAEIDEPELTVPHPHLHERLFVLEPLSALAPDLVLPGGLGPITRLRAACRRHEKGAKARPAARVDIEADRPEADSSSGCCTNLGPNGAEG